MPKSKNRWAANSEWHSIVIVTPTGKTVTLKPTTAVYLSTKKKTMVITVQDVLDGLFQMSVREGIEEPWDYAVQCVSSMVVVKQMTIHDPVTGKAVGKASLTPPRRMMH